MIPYSACTAMKKVAYEGFGSGRDKWQQPGAVIEALELGPGDSIADLGSGTGYFTFRFADAVGEEGQVYAVDVDEALLKSLEKRAAKEGYANMATVLAEYEDPLIPEPVDIIFTSNTFHHFQERPTYFDNAKQYLAEGGRIAIIDLRMEDKGWLGRTLDPHAIDGEVIKADMAAAGYTLVEEHDFLKKQHFMVFAPE